MSTDTEPGINKDLSAPAPTYSRNLTAKEREDRRDQLLVQHRERRACITELTLAQGNLTKAKGEVDRLKRKRDTIDEMCETLALEADTGHAVIPQQLKLGDVPVLANEDGEAIDDLREHEGDEAEPREEVEGNELVEPGDFVDDDPEAGEPGVRPKKKRASRAAQPSA